jgi:hypothetical protein
MLADAYRTVATTGVRPIRITECTPRHAGSSAQDAGVLLDCVDQVDGGDVQLGQALVLALAD